jgi:hypothetical protein
MLDRGLSFAHSDSFLAELAPVGSSLPACVLASLACVSCHSFGFRPFRPLGALAFAGRVLPDATLRGMRMFRSHGGTVPAVLPAGIC